MLAARLASVLFLACLWLPTLAHGQFADSEPEWHRLQHVRQPASDSLLADIDAQLPAGHIYGSPDMVNAAHETTHGINSRIRQSRPGMHGFYVGRGRMITFRSPHLRLTNVAALVPRPFHNDTYGLYLQQQAASWNDTPLYVLDEWTAYCNGTEAGIEQAERGRVAPSETKSIECAVSFCAFATALIQAIDRYDPNYSDRDRLIQFIAWQIDRTFALLDRCKPFPSFYGGRVDQIAAAFFQHFVSEDVA